VLLIFLSAVVNGSSFLNFLIYLNFAILPLSIFYFFYINQKERYVTKKSLEKTLLLISFIQLPILLIQRNFYDILIGFNNNNQGIASVDFLFGTFFLKSDHSLGFLLLLIIINLIFNIKQNFKFINYRFPIAIYLSLTLLLSESNISKALLIATWAIFFLIFIYNKIPKSIFTRKFFIVVSIIFLSIIAYNAKNLNYITSRLGGTIEKNFTVEKSLKFYEEGTAKRLQILVVAINKLDLKIIGDGPYSYFDIRTGQFKNTIHFSQIIWTYFDLGILGLLIVLIYLYNLLKMTIRDNRHLLLFIYPILLIYSFYTTIFMDLAILISFLSIFSLKSNNEFNSNTVSRLEKK
jgi:chromate transport protein ChrA